MTGFILVSLTDLDRLKALAQRPAAATPGPQTRESAPVETEELTSIT